MVTWTRLFEPAAAFFNDGYVLIFLFFLPTSPNFCPTTLTKPTLVHRITILPNVAASHQLIQPAPVRGITIPSTASFKAIDTSKMTNLGRGGDGTSPDSPNVQCTGAWPRNDMHLQYQQSDRDADTWINNYYNTQQDEYPEALGSLYDNLDELLNMEEFDTADHTASNIDPNLMANGSYNPYLSSPPPGPQFGQPLQHAVSAPAPLGSTQNSYTSHVQNQGAVSSPGYYSAPAHSHINTGISTAQFANLPRSDQIRILAEFRHAQHELQNRSHRLPPSGQHGMWQPSSNINSSNFTSPPRHSLHPSIDRITQHIHYTWEGQEHRAFMGNEVSI